MGRRYVHCLLATLLIAGCSASGEPARESQSSADGKLVIGANEDSGNRTDLGRKVGQMVGRNIAVDTSGPAMTSSMVRGIAHAAHVHDKAMPTAKAAFTGGGSSLADLLRLADGSRTSTDQTALMYGYFAAVDPGGTTERVEFYEDGRGCETDVVSRRGNDGVMRTYLVDTTGWHDSTLEATGDRPERACDR